MSIEQLTGGNIEPRGLEEEMRSSYLDYAMSVIVGRALPDVRDGLKPVHRRVLFSMHEAGLQPNRPFRKCVARGRRRDGPVPPPRRRRDLRHPGPARPELRDALPAGRPAGQLRLDRQRSAGRHAVLRHRRHARRHERRGRSGSTRSLLAPRPSRTTRGRPRRARSPRPSCARPRSCSTPASCPTLQLRTAEGHELTGHPQPPGPLPRPPSPACRCSCGSCSTEIRAGRSSVAMARDAAPRVVDVITAARAPGRASCWARSCPRASSRSREPGSTTSTADFFEAVLESLRRRGRRPALRV